MFFKNGTLIQINISQLSRTLYVKLLPVVTYSILQGKEKNNYPNWFW